MGGLSTLQLEAVHACWGLQFLLSTTNGSP